MSIVWHHYPRATLIELPLVPSDRNCMSKPSEEQVSTIGLEMGQSSLVFSGIECPGRRNRLPHQYSQNVELQGTA
jgi:hypothetical protein